MKLFKNSNQVSDITIPVEHFWATSDELPPRLCIWEGFGGHVQSTSLWLRDRTITQVVPNKVWVERRGTVIQLCTTKEEANHVRYNGDTMPASCFLQDGDFILWKNHFRMIVQKYPVGDRRKRFEAWQSQGATPFSEIKLSEEVAQWVVFNVAGASLDGGTTFTRWEDIACFDYGGVGDKHSLELKIYTENHTLQSLPSKLTLPISKFATVFDWLRISAPVDISWTQFAFTHHYETMMDAYLMAVSEKIMVAVENQQRVLPEAIDIIIARNEPRSRIPEWIKVGLWLAAFSALLTTNMFTAEIPERYRVEFWIHLFINVYIILTGLIVFAFIVFIIIANLGQLYDRWREAK